MDRKIIKAVERVEYKPGGGAGGVAHNMGLNERGAQKERYKFYSELQNTYKNLRKKEAVRDKGKLYHSEWIFGNAMGLRGEIAVTLGLIIGVFLGQLFMPAFASVTGYSKMYTYLLVLATGAVTAYGMIFPGIFGRDLIVNRRIRYALPGMLNTGSTTLYWLQLPGFKDKKSHIKPITYSKGWKLQSPIMFITGIPMLLLEVFAVIAALGFVSGAYESATALYSGVEAEGLWPTIVETLTTVIGPSVKAGAGNIIPTIASAASVIFSVKALIVLLFMAMAFGIGYCMSVFLTNKALGKTLFSEFSVVSNAATWIILAVFAFLGFIFLKDLSHGFIANIGGEVLRFFGIDVFSTPLV